MFCRKERSRRKLQFMMGWGLGNSSDIPIPKLLHCSTISTGVSIPKAYIRLGAEGWDRCTLTFFVSICVIGRLVFVNAVKALTSPIQIGGSLSLVAAAGSWHPRGPWKPEIAGEKLHHYCTLRKWRRREVRAKKSWWETHNTGSSTTYLAENDGFFKGQTAGHKVRDWEKKLVLLLNKHAPKIGKLKQSGL